MNRVSGFWVAGATVLVVTASLDANLFWPNGNCESEAAHAACILETPEKCNDGTYGENEGKACAQRLQFNHYANWFWCKTADVEYECAYTFTLRWCYDEFDCEVDQDTGICVVKSLVSSFSDYLTTTGQCTGCGT